MALDTYTNLKTSIGDWLARSDLATVSVDLISLAERDLKYKLRVKEMETRYSFQINSQFTNLPTGFLEARELKVLIGSVSSNSTSTTSLNQYGVLDFVAPHKFDAVYQRGVTGTPSFFTIRGSELQVDEIPGIISSQTVSSLTSSGTTVTLTTSTAHSISEIGTSITVSGATQTAYNGTFTIVTIPSTTTLTYTALSTPAASPATGTPIYVVNNMELTYWVFPTVLSDSNASNSILTNYPDCYLFGSLQHAVSYTQDNNMIQLFTQKFQESIDKANMATQSATYTGSPLQMRFT